MDEEPENESGTFALVTPPKRVVLSDVVQLTLSPSENVVPRLDVDDERPARGVVPTSVPRGPMWTTTARFRMADPPRWRPKVVGDYGRSSREDD